MSLDWVFIFPCQMGIFGRLLQPPCPDLSMMILSPHFIRKNNQFHFAKCMPEIRRFVRILSSGVPSLVTEVSSGIVIIVFNSILLNLAGNVGVAAYGVIANLSLVIIAIYTGIAQGIQPIISSNYGAKIPKYQVDPKYAMTTMLILSVLIYVTYFWELHKLQASLTAKGTLCCKTLPQRL